jgi:DNA repair protein RAD50
MRLHRETVDVGRDVEKLESELSATGSTATSDEIQAKLSDIAEKM